MKYVLDANIALKWVVAEPDSPKAIQLRDAFDNAIHELIAPDIFELEIAHAHTRAERQGRILFGQASIFWADIMSGPPVLEPSGQLVARALTISSAARIGFYDCLYACLAEREGCLLVTADAKLAKNLSSFPIVTLDAF